MLVHLRVISMFVFAFVLVFLASSNYEIYSRSPEKSREAKNSTLRVDQKSVISNTEMKTYFSGEVKQLGSRARVTLNTARVASHLDSNVSALIMEFGTGEGHAPRQTYGSRKFASPRSSNRDGSSAPVL